MTKFEKLKNIYIQKQVHTVTNFITFTPFLAETLTLKRNLNLFEKRYSKIKNK